MTDASGFFGEDFDLNSFLEMLRKSASVKAGAVIFGEAQVAYYEALKQGMSDEMAYNMLAHTTEQMLRAIAQATGPVAEALLKAVALADKSGVKTEMPKPSDEDYEVDAPGVKR